jgi:hypothetical protein
MVVSLSNSQGRAYATLRDGWIMIAPPYDFAEGSSSCLEFKHMKGIHVALNCQGFEESCRTWTENRVGSFVSCDSRWYMGSDYVCF